MRNDMNATEMLARLIGFRTVSKDSNLDCIDFIRDYLAERGIASTLVPSADGVKANLYATIGPDLPDGIVLSGHTDVVPAESQIWTSDPWTLTERDDRLYGRGTCDMKGFVAIALTAAAAASRGKLARPLHLALSYDEEVGCLGAPSLVAAMADRIGLPNAVIVGEPSSLRVVTGHKSSLSFFTEVTGHTVHSSEVHRGVSAVMVAARLVTWFDDAMARNRGAADRTLPFDPPYTTLHCGFIHGGTAANIVASSCDFVTDVRSIPGDDYQDYQRRYEAYVQDEIVPAMQAVAPETGVRVLLRGFVPGLQPRPDNPAETLARRVTGDNTTNVVSYGTEGGIFQAVGWPTVVCGPGSISQAHQPDEFITVEQMQAGERFVAELVGTLTA
jgi:acetylornithine deacetylase